MKILVLSLLRLGDLILHTSVIKGLKEKYPDCELQFLINESARSLEPLIQGVSKLHVIDRSSLQAAIANYDKNIWEPVEIIETTINKLNGEDFDLCINLTQSRFSGWIMSLIDAPNKIGLSFNDQGYSQFHSSWFRYLNDYVAKGVVGGFHFVDIFNYALGTRESNPEFALFKTISGEKLCNEVLANQNIKTPFIVVQALTSDAKKNWGIERFSETLYQFNRINPSIEIVLLGAQFEASKIKELQKLCKIRGVKVKTACGDLAMALSLLQRAELLLTGDTSIKHLASAAKCKVIELCVGSSDLRSTGAYLDKGLILQAQAPCFPCNHRDTCHQPNYFCKLSLPTHIVAKAINIVLTDEWIKFEQKEFAPYAKQLLKTELGPCGFWVAEPVVGDERLAFVFWERLLKCSWKLHLSGEMQHLVGGFGNEGLKLAQWNDTYLTGKNQTSDWIEDNEANVIRTAEELRKVKSQFPLKQSRSGYLKTAINNIGNLVVDWGEQKAFEFIKRDLSDGTKGTARGDNFCTSFSEKRKAEIFINDYCDRGEINSKIFRSMKNHTLENL